MLNCKRGDLAVVIKSGKSYGYVVTCLDRYDGPWRNVGYTPGWHVDQELPQISGRARPFIADFNLRPIRYSDGEDEMLRLAGKPAASLV